MRARISIMALAAITLAACEMTTPSGPQPASIEIQGAVSELLLGTSTQLSSVVRDENGAPVPDALVNWSSTSPLVASVSETGLVRALSEGTSQIVAQLDRAADTTEVTVRRACSSVDPQDTIPLLSFTDSSPGGTHCLGAGGSKTIRGFHLVLPTDYQVRLSLYPVAVGDEVLITTGSGTDTVYSTSPRIVGSGGSYYLILDATTTLGSGSYVVWVMRSGSADAGPALTVTTNVLCRGVSINRSLAVNDSVTTGHTATSCLIDGTYAEGWTFTTADSSALSFSLLLDRLDRPHLVIADSAMTTSMRVFANTDDLMLDVIVPPGTWRLWVTGDPPYPMYPSGVLAPPRGYQFTLTRNPAPLVCGAATTPLPVGMPVAGTLNSSDCVKGGASPRARIDQFTFTVATETTFDFELSADFLPGHLLRASNDSVVMIEGALNGSSIATRKTLAPGTYTYVVRSGWPGTGGSYTVTVTEP